MAIRWIYKTWSALWTIIAVLLTAGLVLGAIGFGVLQLPSTKNYIAQKIEERFNAQHNGVLTIGEITGTLPFNIQITDLNLYPDSVSAESVFSSDSVSASFNVPALFRNRFILTALTVTSPRFTIDSENDKSLIYAVQRKTLDTETPSDSSESASEAPFVEVLAPSVKVNDGRFLIKNLIPPDSPFYAGDSLTFQNVELEMFLDYSLEQRFLDIEHLSLFIPELGEAQATAFGQIFNDDRFLEFNAFNLNIGKSSLKFSGEADGVDLLKGNIDEQLLSSGISFSLEELVTYPKQLKKIFPAFPDSDKQLKFSFYGQGDVDSLWFDDFSLGMGGSELDGYGFLRNPLEQSELSYGLEITSVLADSGDLALFFPELTAEQITALENSSYEAGLKGTTESIAINAEVTSRRGHVIAEAKTRLSEHAEFEAKARFDSVDISGLLTDKVSQSRLSGSVDIRSNSTQLKSARGAADIKLWNSSVNNISVDSLLAESEWASGIFTPSFYIKTPVSTLDGMGTVNVTDSIPAIEFSGSGTGIELHKLLESDSVKSSSINVEYELFLEGSTSRNVYGQLSMDVPFAVVEGDTLAPHQFYADFSEPYQEERSIRVTSTALDFSVNGEFNLETIPQLAQYWRAYFEERIAEEIQFKPVTENSIVLRDTTDQRLDIDFSIKELELIRAYYPAFPEIYTGMSVTSEINASGERLLFNATIRDNEFSLNKYEVDSLTVQVTGSFRHGEKLKSFAGLQAEIKARSFNTEYLSGEGVALSLDMNEDSIFFSQNIDQIAEEAILNSNGSVFLNDTSLTFKIDEFQLGTELYSWENRGQPTFSYTNDKKLIFQEFSFINYNEFISLEGVYSDEVEDSVNYVIRSVNLDRISDLVNGRIDFSGDLNGDFTTRALTRIPTIQGSLNINGLALDDRVVGDINLQSNFNQELNRFDTQVRIATDSTKYPQYFQRNNRDGQDILLDGYVLAPVNGELPQADSLFKFNLDFESVDLWVIPFIAPNVFSEMAGMASGKGYIWGNTETYDFSVDYEVGMDDAVYMKPRFLDTYYYAQGLVTFNKTDGLIFRDVFVIDPSGGSAILSGSYNLNDFQRLHYIDLQLEMDEFQFLNNEFDPLVPFFGEAYGSTTVSLTGTNLNPVLSTLTPVYISDFSNIGIPLLDETEFDEDSKFIRFVDDFKTPQRLTSEQSEGDESTENEEEDPFNRSFNERFTLDLQFIATQPMTVQLIFDPVTGDIIEADGTGRLRIRLQDEELTMYGRFDIIGGSYNFVSGDIFAREFELESGGTIIWDGSPNDARLNLNAIYEARPDINTLTQARSEIDRENSQRVPVQLVLNVGGSLTSIENNFYFRLPNTFESRQNSTLSTQINALNRNEDEKLIQATSFLLMGDFIPYATASSDATNTFTNNLSGSAAVLNPLISSQVISPLLSNQINSLLRSDIGSLDIDFNLNTYNNVDLGVALRLYNDRIILSREGQITGAQSNIGDLGATYRINQTFSVTAFHRQDPTFSNFSAEETQQAQDINGVGVEAEVSFNSWREFFRKLSSPFRWLFGKKGKTQETQNSDEEGVASTINQNLPQ